MTTRGYLTPKQYTSLTGKTLATEEAETLIEKAEALIDSLLGFWQPAIGHLQGVAAAASTTSLTLQPEHARLASIDLLEGCVVEFLKGEAAGTFRVVKNSSLDGVIEFDKPFDDTPEAGDVYHIFQMGKIPRLGRSDVTTMATSEGNMTVRKIPAQLREAVAAQVSYMVELGADYFDSNAMNMDSESFGSYSYTKSEGSKGAKSMIAPRAREALAGSGLINRTARIVGY